jgi:hypothetical protein
VKELAWVTAIVLLMVAIGASQGRPPRELIDAGNLFMLRSAALGLPLELVYYGLLWLALSASGVRPTGWYWRPFMHHHLLSRGQKLLVLPLFYAGALAFLGIVLGIAAVVLGMVAAVRQL